MFFTSKLRPRLPPSLNEHGVLNGHDSRTLRHTHRVASGKSTCYHQSLASSLVTASRLPPMSVLRQCLHGNSSGCVVSPLATQLLQIGHLGQLKPWPSQRTRHCSSVIAEGAKSREAQLQWVSPENRWVQCCSCCHSGTLAGMGPATALNNKRLERHTVVMATRCVCCMFAAPLLAGKRLQSS